MSKLIDRDWRAQFFDEARALTNYVSVESQGLTFLVSTADQVVARTLFVKGSRSEFGVLRRALAVLEDHGIPAAGTFVDCGANIGTTTLPALARFERAIAFEPEPENARLLAANVAFNGLAERVTIHQAAVSDREGEAQLQVNARNAGGHVLRKTGGLTVPVVTLDSAIPAEEPVGMLWLDGLTTHLRDG